ncbi:MAG: malate dehydrogenase, partial [Microcoleus sp. SIO2G3]|nr:malate dehydrogenase [Microcoleus sp. SIO2G3]
MQTGGAYYAPASATCCMVEAILHQQSRLLASAAYLQGQYGLDDIFIGVPVKLGGNGIEQILELDLTETELAALARSANSVRESLDRALTLL